MRVAIMGAGLSGLACAITLEKNGIQPHIFESRGQVGDRFVNGEAFLSILSKQDEVRYFWEEHGIHVQTAAHIRRMIIHGPSEKAVINGFLGHITIRGRDQDSTELNLAEQLQTSYIHYHSNRTYEDLLQDYTHIVIAAGDGAVTKEMQQYDVDLSAALRGTTIEGKFDPYTVHTWINHDLAPKGNAYLLPFSDKEASLAISYPEYANDPPVDSEQVWQTFMQTARRDLQQDLKITDQFNVSGYLVGQCQQSRIGNTFFTGNCFGTIMPFLGFGQFHSLLTGIYAARDICGKGVYDQLVQPIRKDYRHSLTLRRGFEQLSNEQFDFIVRQLNGYWGKRLFHSRTVNPLKLAAYLLRPFFLHSASPPIIK